MTSTPCNCFYSNYSSDRASNNIHEKSQLNYIRHILQIRQVPQKGSHSDMVICLNTLHHPSKQLHGLLTFISMYGTVNWTMANYNIGIVCLLRWCDSENNLQQVLQCECRCKWTMWLAYTTSLPLTMASRLHTGNSKQYLVLYVVTGCHLKWGKGPTCFFFDFTQNVEESWLHSVAIQGVFPATKYSDFRDLK